ncbi:hypothetical protein ACFLZQ_04150 [Thermodesulfobacteriota bacterium]
MKNITEFLKTTILGGLFVLLPVILVYLALSEVLDLIVAMATPIADLFFPGKFEEAEFPVLIALALLVAISFILGLIMLSDTGRMFGNWIERIILGKLPAYNAIKNLTTGFTNSQQESSFKPAMLKSADGNKEFAYIIEDHGDGNLTIMLPWAPTPFAGSVKIVPNNRIEKLAVSMGKLTETLSHWGIGAQALIAEKSESLEPEK